MAGSRPYLHLLAAAQLAPTSAPPSPTRDIPRLPMRPGIGPRRHIIVWAANLIRYVTLSCGHTIYGEFARTTTDSARCPMCAGSGPEFYACVSRRGYDIRRRALTGKPAHVDWWQTRMWAWAQLFKYNGGPLIHVR